MNFDIENKKVFLSNINAEIVNSSLKNIFKKDYFSRVDFKKSLSIIDGDITYYLKTNKIIPKIKFKVKKAISLNVFTSFK